MLRIHRGLVGWCLWSGGFGFVDRRLNNFGGRILSISGDSRDTRAVGAPVSADPKQGQDLGGMTRGTRVLHAFVPSDHDLRADDVSMLTDLLTDLLETDIALGAKLLALGKSAAHDVPRMVLWKLAASYDLRKGCCITDLPSSMMPWGKVGQDACHLAEDGMTDDENDDFLEERLQTFINQMHGITQSLVRLNPASKRPVLLKDPKKGGSLIASGFFVIHNGKRLLLSAKHVLCAGSWALETKVVFKEERECLLFSLGPAGIAPTADLGWVELDEEKMRRDFQADPRPKGRSFELPYYKGPLGTLPKDGEAYGYAASNNVTLVSRLDNPDLWREGSYEVCMEFDGRAADGRYRFKLARTHQSHGYYCGSSGAPIADPEGRIVSVVSGGDEPGNVIFGTPLADVVDLLPT